MAVTAGQAVEYAHAHEARLRLDRRERELVTAKQVQLHFLPQSRPDVPGYRFFDYYSSAEEVGGDYYGYVPLPDGRIAVAIGDVSGKGITAALVMARLCSEVRYRLVTAPDPGLAVLKLNEELSKPENDAWFVTFVLCILDPRSSQLTIINAGHKAPICRRSESGSVEELGTHSAGLPLGCDASVAYTPFTATLRPGDALIMYTDGINEAMNPKDKLYGNKRVQESIAQGAQHLEELCSGLLSDVRQFTEDRLQNDDICLIGLQRE
jgi:serine phosphatase RsbU (regulator of sigma subunit)